MSVGVFVRPAGGACTSVPGTSTFVLVIAVSEILATGAIISIGREPTVAPASESSALTGTAQP